MRPRLSRFADTGRAVGGLAREHEVTFLAAAIAYYGLVSVVPALVLALVVAVLVGGAALADRLLAVTAAVLTPAARSVVGQALVGAGNRGGVTVLGLAVLGWGALKGFRGLDRAFSRIYRSSGELSFADGLVNAVAGLAGVGVAFVLMVALGGVLAALPVPVAGWLLGLAVLLVGLFVAFLPLYVRFPGRPVAVREAAPGAAFAAVGWVALQTGFQLYAAASSIGDLYGVLGGVLLLVTWFYLAAIVILVGAVLNVVLAAREPSTDRQAEDRGEPATG